MAPSDDSKRTPGPSQRRSGGLGTGAFTKVLDHLKEDRDRDAEQQAATIAALERSHSALVRVIIALVVVLAVLVAGVIGVGVTGKVPGLGEIEVVKP